MAEVRIQGWCPTALRPMQSGDGLVVRIAPPLARLTVAQGRGIARAAQDYGNGLIDLSSRGNVQLRGVRAGTYGDLLADLTALGLIPAQEVNVTVSPYWRTGDRTEAVFAALTATLAAPGAPRTPGKFGYAIDLGGHDLLRSVSADVRIEGQGGGLLVWPDGFATGAVVATAVEAALAARDLAAWFMASGGMQAGRGRMAGLWPGDAAREARLPEAFRAAQVADSAAALPEPGPQVPGFLVGFEFGQLAAATLNALASRPLRVTPWRMLLLEGATEAPDLPGLITDPNDPRRRVTGCTGAPGCLQGLQPTRPLARALAALVPQGQHLHVSGCAKGCAHPAPADVVLTATKSGYAVIRNGRASDRPIAAYSTSASLFKGL